MSEQLRKLHRRKSAKVVRFIQTTGGDGVECRMSDMHSEGAKLTFDGIVPATGREVEIMILPELIPKKAIRVWSSGNEIGIKFREPISYLMKNDHRLL
jgi:hypothetical protein